ncbi:hypothetical protein [Aquimarina agarivorans]|uniref:hypothetical protein n=1 Tax=Aquimarina agarivorans TaxID=980584 RepID=UPI000248E97C|nr:hypothetical protein [Aquimarina agarivorans]
MKLTIRLVQLVVCFGFMSQLMNAQDSIPKTKTEIKLKKLNALKDEVKKIERELLKKEVKAIDSSFNNKLITKEQAIQLKKEAAKKRASNINNRIAIIDNKLLLLQRNENEEDFETAYLEESIEKFLTHIDENDQNENSSKKDKRIRSGLLFAVGFNNALVEGASFEDSPYKFGGSRFFEIGWEWKSRVFKNTNFMRFNHGIALQMNGLKPDNNRFFVNRNNQIVLEDFENDLDKSKLTITNLVIPVHFEFGPSNKVVADNKISYDTKKQFKLGLGGYLGANIGARQKLKYIKEGQKVKEKQKKDFSTSNIIYGLSGYVAIGATALYVKYDLSPIFENQNTTQNNVSLGVRFNVM